MKRTIQEIAALKSSWAFDPCWDIEETEGFEDHYEELQEWRLEIERKNAEDEDNRVKQKAEMLRCSPAMVIYIETLERRIKELQETVKIIPLIKVECLGE